MRLALPASMESVPTNSKPWRQWAVIEVIISTISTRIWVTWVTRVWTLLRLYHNILSNCQSRKTPWWRLNITFQQPMLALIKIFRRKTAILNKTRSIQGIQKPNPVVKNNYNRSTFYKTNRWSYLIMPKLSFQTLRVSSLLRTIISYQMKKIKNRLSSLNNKIQKKKKPQQMEVIAIRLQLSWQLILTFRTDNFFKFKVSKSLLPIETSWLWQWLHYHSVKISSAC